MVGNSTGARFTTAELARFRLPGFPTTPQGWDKLVKKNGWSCEIAHGRGRGGERHEYTPPAEVMSLIEKHLRGETIGAQKAMPALHLQRGGAAPPSSAPTRKAAPLDEALLQACLAACALVCGESFQTSNVAHQVRYASELYNLLGRLFAAGACDRSAALGYAALSEDDLAELLRIAQKAGWIRNYVKPLPPLPSPQGGGRFLHK